MAKLLINSYDTLDDLLNDVFEDLVNLPFDVIPTRGKSCEIIGAAFNLKNPRARLSRTETKGTVYSALGELLWYLSKDNNLKFITHYLPRYKDETEDNLTVYGGYGPRLFKLRGEYNQIDNVIKLLTKSPFSRKAVIQLFDGMDINDPHKEIPCTCTMQFLIRHKKLHMYTSMRSNDAYKGLPHDIFAFTMLQEIMARSLKVELGEYYHSVGSLHLYSDTKTKAKQYLGEGFQSTILAMPEMPTTDDPWEAIDKLLCVELLSRTNKTIDFPSLELDQYWLDLAKLIKIHSLFLTGDYGQIKKLQDGMNPIYNVYINKRLVTSRKNKIKSD
ncbi:MAG: thyA [Mucilaginibacter sp.]|nr:thyA [Mucilaginibacter sp.]